VEQEVLRPTLGRRYQRLVASRPMVASSPLAWLLAPRRLAASLHHQPMTLRLGVSLRAMPSDISAPLLEGAGSGKS
jgi:hypothetical protein